VNIFGLPSRTVEDILADLLKQNRISLRLETGEVEILNRPTLRRRHRPGLPIDVWQDDFTGAILPLKKVFMYANQEEVRQVAHFKSVIDGSAGFLDMPDSRILAMLAPFDRAMRVSHEGWVPEKLREKTRVGFVPIYAPVAMVNVNDLEIPFIDAPYLPAWLTKIWSRELSEGSECGDGSEGLALLDFSGSGALRSLFAFQSKRHDTSGGSVGLGRIPAPSARGWKEQMVWRRRAACLVGKASVLYRRHGRRSSRGNSAARNGRFREHGKPRSNG